MKAVLKTTAFLIAIAAITLLLVEAAGPALGEQATAPDCGGYGKLAKKAYKTKRWFKTADPSPATKGEDKRLDVFINQGCPSQIRHHEKHQYAAFYNKVITPCGDFVRCDVAQCESGSGTTSGYTYGFTVYWAAIGPLPVKGNKTGTRFAPSEPAATRYEDNVFAYAAFHYGPTPGTCAS